MTARPKFLTTYDLHRLDLACYPIVSAFDCRPYLVGSAAERTDYNDVDVRLMLLDESFDALFSGRREFWSLVCYAITAWLRADTGLPIDFQIQRMTEAIVKYGSQTRNPLGGRLGMFAGYGDATGLAIPRTDPGEAIPSTTRASSPAGDAKTKSSPSPSSDSPGTTPE